MTIWWRIQLACHNSIPLLRQALYSTISFAVPNIWSWYTQCFHSIFPSFKLKTRLFSWIRVKAYPNHIITEPENGIIFFTAQCNFVFFHIYISYCLFSVIHYSAWMHTHLQSYPPHLPLSSHLSSSSLTFLIGAKKSPGIKI